MDELYDDDYGLDNYDDDRYLHGSIMAHERNPNEKIYCGFGDFAVFENVLRSIADAIEDGTAYVGHKKHGKSC